MNEPVARLCRMLFFGTVIGAAIALVLGLLFGSGVPSTLAMELTIYVVVGGLVGFIVGLGLGVLQPAQSKREQNHGLPNASSNQEPATTSQGAMMNPAVKLVIAWV